MIVNTLIFICCVCVVKGYAVVNAFDDDSETQKSTVAMGLEKSQKITDCNPMDCVQLCRRLGLKDGFCIDGKCQCISFIEINGADIEPSPKTDADISSLISECSPLGCAQLCRRIGLKGGVCVRGKCKCDLFIDSEGANVETSPKIDLDTSSSISECSPVGCAQLCRRLGLKGGVCVRGKCKCDLFIDLEGDTENLPTMCNWSSCDRGCRSIGYPGGICVGSECRCNPRLETETETENNNRIENLDGQVRVMVLEKPSPIISDCNPLACEQLCRRIFLKGGVCVNGRCKCDIIIDSEESNKIPATSENQKEYGESEMELKQKSSVKMCFTSECVSMCRRIGFNSGACDIFKDACKCY